MPKRPTLLIILLILLFGIPLFSAFFLFKERAPLSSHTTNHGTLITPPLDLTIIDLKDEQGQSVPQSAWKGKWLMLYVNATENCDAQCDKNLYDIRQIRTATGKDSRRVERAILTFPQTTPDQHLQNVLKADFSGTSHFVISQDTWQRFITTHPSTRQMQNAIFLVDPLGNVMMMYPQGEPPMDIFKDLTRLLKLSRIG